MKFLQYSYTDFTTRTKLNLIDVHKLSEICLNKCYLLYNKGIRNLEDLGPIGLSITAVLSQCLYRGLEERSTAIAFALTKNL